MKQRLLCVVVLLALVASGIGGFFSRPFADLWMAENQIGARLVWQSLQFSQEMTVALAAQEAWPEMVRRQLIVNEKVETIVTNREVQKLMETDPRYAVMREIEGMFPFVYIINVIDEEDKVTVWAWLDVGAIPVITPAERADKWVEAMAAVIESTLENFASAEVVLYWAIDSEMAESPLQETPGIFGPCWRLTADMGFTAGRQVFAEWLVHDADDLRGGMDKRIRQNEIEFFIDSMFTPWVFCEGVLERLSGDDVPWLEECEVCQIG